MALSEAQNRFLERLKRNKLDIEGTLESMGLDTVHLMAWQENPEFDLEYRSVVRQIIQYLNQENYVNAIRKLNDALINGTREYTSKEISLYDTENNYIGTKRENSQKYIKTPAWAIKEAMKETSLETAINQLANEGVLPTTVARKILLEADKITKKLQDSFEVSSDADLITEQKAITLIKQAVLNTNE